MPTNLPPEYFAAERKFKEAESTAAKIETLEELISTIPKHKGTDKLRADLRRKLSRLRDDQKKSKSTGKFKSEYHIDKEGAIRLVLTGPPNTGKSSLLSTLTHAEPKISDYPFTTWTPLPGMMPVEDIQVQLIDTPPLNNDHMESELFDLIKSADLILLVVDLQASPLMQLEESLRILEDHRIIPHHFKENYSNPDKMHFFPFILVVNKNDDDNFDEDFEIFCELLEKDCPYIPVSARSGRNLDKLGKLIFENLDVMRIYSKPPGYDPDLSRPFVLKAGSKLEEFAIKVHKDFEHELKNARVWGSHVHDGQLVGREHILHDKDIVELHK